MKTNEEVLNELKQHISEISDERYTLRKIKPTDINDDYYEMQDLIKQDLLEQAHQELREVCADRFEYLDACYTIDAEDLEDADFNDLTERLERPISEIAVIYYSTAMNYLLKNDPSLHKSLSIAEEYGYSPSNLSSEVLATLLAQQIERDAWNNLESEISEILEAVNDTINNLDIEDIINQLNDEEK